jgi:acetyl-CoA carboxylase biotin carboxyl carrier protein
MLSEDDVREILRLIDDSPLDELRIETEGFSLHVLRAGASASGAPVQSPAARAAASASQIVPTEAAAAASAPTREGTVIEAPMLGTFYRAEAPGATPFVEVGARVEPDTIVCLIEVMKMMNSVPARVAGTIVEVCAENAALVEYGQPLFVVQAPGE